MRRIRLLGVFALVCLVGTACGGSVETATTAVPTLPTSSSTVVTAPPTTSEATTTTTTAPPTTTTTTEPPTTTSSSIPELPPGVENVVMVNLINRYNFNADQVFENREVEGSLQTHVWLDNVADDSQAPVYGLGLSFSTDLRVTTPGDEPTRISDGVLTWEFGDVQEADQNRAFAGDFGANIDFGSPVRFTPGMDASMSLDTIDFSEPGTQTIVLTIVARRDFSFWDFIFHLDPPNADVEVVSFEPGEHVGPVGERIRVTPNREDVGVDTLPPLRTGETYTFEMTVSVDPKQPQIRYKPFVAIASLAPGEGSPVVVTGNALSLPVGDLGTWEYTSAGPCRWEWQEGLQYNLTLNG